MRLFSWKDMLNTTKILHNRYSLCSGNQATTVIILKTCKIYCTGMSATSLQHETDHMTAVTPTRIAQGNHILIPFLSCIVKLGCRIPKLSCSGSCSLK